MSIDQAAGLLVRPKTFGETADTYVIDERKDSGIPGMARITGLIKRIREVVTKQVGEDRTLVLHSGDYLSPSFMSRHCGGQQGFRASIWEQLWEQNRAEYRAKP